jgi:glucose/arabinose dehydrogenase
MKRVLMSAAVVMLLAACSAPPASVAPTAMPRATETTPATAAPTEAATADATESPTAAPTEAAEPTASPAAGQALQPVLQEYVSGLEQPTYLTHAGDGSGLLYVTEQPGRVRVIQNGALVPTPFLDIEDKVGSSGNEQGLLSVAFAPDYTASRKMFANYTDRNGDTVVAGFLVNEGGLTADPASQWQVMKIEQPYSNHNGGQLKFGPDGMLYIGMGDGGSAGDPQNYGQRVEELLGKMLRIDVSQSTADAPYAVPADNPSFGPESKPEIWSVGVRNPWRFSFDRETGDMFMADVGQNQIEEINFQPATSGGGENWGWKLREGFEEFTGPKTDAMTDPIFEYRHGEDGCSVTGGYVYRGASLPALAGAYVYGDFCSGRVWDLRPGAGGNWVNTRLFETNYSITSFGEDEQGELYVLDRSGTIYKLVGE